MLPRFDTTVMPVRPADGVGGAAAIGDNRQLALQRALQNIVGQSVTAEVLSKFNDGSSLVKVADTAVRMMLPPGVNAGDAVPLTVLSATPRPTFQLGNGTPGAATLVYTEGGAADGGEALYSPASLASQQAPAQLPGGARPQGGGAAPGADAGAAEAAADGDGAAPGAPRPGTASASPGAQPGIQSAAPRPGARPGDAAPAPAPAAGAGQSAADDAAPAGPAARPGSAAGAPTAGAAANAPAAAASNAAPGSAATPASAPAAAGVAAQAAGGALPADAVKPQSLAATLLGKAPLTPAGDLPRLDHTTPQSTLSSTARVLTTVLTTAQAGQTAQLALIGKTALFGNGAPDTDALTQKLQDTISKSGLFYESHVTEWAKGERTLPELMREPQMQRMAQAGESAARAAAGGPDLSAAQMINQQLHTHEQGRVQWQGEAWPGQAMQWEVRREQRQGGGHDGGGDADEAPEAVWRSGVRFRFALLGEVEAAVTIVGGQVHIQVQAGSGDAAEALRRHAGRLERAMEAAGAPLSSLHIAGDASGGGDGR